MGTGKTTVGRLLAKKLGWGFLDTDDMITVRLGKSIPDIFKEDGEERFRQEEKIVVEEIARGSQTVVATGGGIVLCPENRLRLKSCGRVFLLTASEDNIYKRVSGDSSRPLLSAENGALMERIEGLLHARRESYLLAADHVIATDMVEPEEVASIILRILEGWEG